jgi:hypothetical protein
MLKFFVKDNLICKFNSIMKFEFLNFHNMEPQINICVCVCVCVGGGGCIQRALDVTQRYTIVLVIIAIY